MTHPLLTNESEGEQQQSYAYGSSVHAALQQLVFCVAGIGRAPAQAHVVLIVPVIELEDHKVKPGKGRSGQVSQFILTS